MSSSSAISEAIAEQTEVALFKRDTIRETLAKLHSQSTDLMHLTVQWKDLECHFDSIQKTIDEEVDDLKQKQQQLEWKSKFLNQRWKEIGVKAEEIERRDKELVAEKKEIDDRCLEIDQTYQLVAMCHARAEETAQGLEQMLRRLQVKEGRLISKLEKVEDRRGRLIAKRKVLKRKLGSLKEWKNDLVCREVKLDARASELNLREKTLNSIERGLLETIQEFEPKEKRLTERETELKREEKRFLDRYNVLIDNERCLNTVLARLRGEEVGNADIRFYITMNGRDLVDFLNRRANDLEIMRGEVTRALKLSSNPASLVLDAMQGFYGVNSEEIFDLSIVRRSCIVLLEQLTELKPQIRIQERQRARSLALEWKARMKADIYQNLEVVGFLQLVDTYRLTYGFDKDELAKSIETAAHLPQAPAFCRTLGLDDKVHDIVQHLIQDRLAVEAVRFIHEFNLNDTFPPAPILRNYLESVLSAADNISKVDPLAKEQILQIQATDMKLAALVTVIRCIKEFKLESEYSTDSLEEQVLDLQRQRGCKPSIITSEDPPIQLQNSGSTTDSISLPLTSIAATDDSNVVNMDLSDDIAFSPELPLTSTMKADTFLSSRHIPSPSTSFADSNLSPIRHPVSSNSPSNLVSGSTLPTPDL